MAWRIWFATDRGCYLAGVHPLQAVLPSNLEPVWLGALGDAGISPDQALLFTFSGTASPDGECATYMRRGESIEVVGLDDELDAELNNDANGCVDAYRVLLWTERSLEGSAALIRHELEHARQLDARHEIQALHQLALDVVRLDPDSGQLYQRIPAEADANAAAGTWVRSYFGAGLIDRLVEDGDPDAAALRPSEPPPSPDDLPERMVDFFVSIADQCRRWAEHWNFHSFAMYLDEAWRGAGAKWTQMTEPRSSGKPPDA